MFYDALLVLALMILVTISFIAVRGGEPVEAGDNHVYQFCLVLVAFVFYTGFWSRSGRTLGMQSWRLRLETPDGRIPSFAAASLRFFVAILSWLPVGLGYLWSLWDEKGLTWHDRISGTRLRYYPKQ